MTHARDDVRREDLRAAALSGVRWVSAGRVVCEMAAFASTLVLARLLTPREFGVVAVALVVQALASCVTTSGIAAALVQRAGVSRAHARASMAIALAAGVAGTGATVGSTFALRPLIGDAVADNVLLASPVFLLVALGATAHGLLQRRLAFAALTAAEAVSTLTGIISGVVLALAGLGASALIIGALARSLVHAIVVVAVARPGLPRWHAAEGREILAFAAPAAFGSAGHLAFRQVDYVIVAAQAGLSQAGFFWRAYQLAFEYQQKLSVVMQKLAFPIYARGRDIADMRHLRLRIVRVHGVLMFPLLFWLIAVAPELIPWLYGAQWEPVVVPVQILAVGALAVPILAGTGALLLAAGRPRELMAINWLTAGAYAAVVLAVAGQGLRTLCVAIVAFQAVKLVLIQRLVVARVLGVRTRMLLRETLPGLTSGVALLAVTAAIDRGLAGAGVPGPLAIALATPVGALTYLWVLRTGHPAAWRDGMLIVQRVLRRPASVGRARRAVVKPAEAR